MNDPELMKRVVGILTAGTAIADGDDPSAENAITTLLLEVMNDSVGQLMLPADMPRDEVLREVGLAFSAPVMQLVGAFTGAFVLLAKTHDAGRTDITSAQVLQELVLRAKREG